MKDRRKHKREKISPHLKIVIPATGESFGAFITNLSEGGVEVYTDRKISEGAQVQLFLSFTSKAGQGKEEVVEGEIRWVKSATTRFLVGTAFTKIDPAKHPMLCDLLKFVE
ncbi:MAG: PilZ domain-containing protein [Nitrospirae bacterium]|nr:PilZ domain-containing protein [Nitrospirota bacterium]